MSTKWQRDMLAYAASIGVQSAKIEHGGRHPHIVGTVENRPFRFVFAGTPRRSFRSQTNYRSEMKRVMRECQGQSVLA